METDAAGSSDMPEGNQPMETDDASHTESGLVTPGTHTDTTSAQIPEQMDAQSSNEVATTSLNVDNREQSDANLSESNQENLATLAAVSTRNLPDRGNNEDGQSTDIKESGDKSNETVKTVADNMPSSSSPTPTIATKPPMDEEEAKWHTVGIFQGLSTTVNNYIDNSEWCSYGLNIHSENLPDLTKYPRINLEPGTAYRFRIRAINTVGASDWSEVSSFKTCQPGFPGAPSAIKISKSSEGAHLTWEPPPSCTSYNEIIEYSVYLAVRPGKEKEAKAGQRTPAQLVFVRVYVGSVNQCTVSHTSLSAAHVDCSNKPAIIFRIAARNEKGYGPATQVRWLQDPVQGGNAATGLGQSSLLSPTRIKPEMSGASPSKRFKANSGVVSGSSNPSRLMLPPGVEN